MARILESILIDASPQSIWEYVQDYRRRADWDVTTLRFEPLGSETVGNHVRIHVLARGGMDYEGIYVSYEPYLVSAVKMTRPIRKVPFRQMAGSWRYKPLDEKTEFTMTLEYEVKGGVFSRLFDRLLLQPAMQRGMRSALKNLQRHFQLLSVFHPNPASSEYTGE